MGATVIGMLRRALAIPVLLALALALLAGCTSDGDPAAAPSATTPAASPSVTATPTPSPTAALPTGCDSLLPFTDLDRALGRPLFGQSVFIEGVPQPSIGRTGRVTCRYGIRPGARGAAPVEVGVSTYTDAESATRRVEATVAAARRAGATQAQATVSGVPATILGERTGVTLVLAQGSVTLAITVQRSLRGDVGRAAAAMAETVLANLEQ